MYKIEITKHALKEILSLPTKTSKLISKTIENLASNPRPQGCKKLKGEKEYLWRVRVGDYRVIYDIQDKVEIIEIRKVGHRKHIYE
ncbi:MAG: type II toxin-antitoxin system RelE/ParE family toxin [Bacteroidota bacterium]|nr:type II toxin-antitoxin system RelE/ParE family toxin [Bacteroidota bacterium]